MTNGTKPVDETAPAATPGTQRLDKWLWYARVVKSRTLAAGLVTDGRVRVNRIKIDKPSQSVRIGDVITFTVGPRLRVLKVQQPGVRRGPSSEAQALYEDLTPPPVPAADAPPVTAARDPGSGRPTKRERRLTDRLKPDNC